MKKNRMSTLDEVNTGASKLRLQIGLVGLLCLSLVWATAFFELSRSRSSHIHEAEVRNTVQARVFAEYTRSTIKRLDEILHDMRPHWSGDAKAFSQVIQNSQGNIKDLTFQVAVIDQ